MPDAPRLSFLRFLLQISKDGFCQFDEKRLKSANLAFISTTP